MLGVHEGRPWHRSESQMNATQRGCPQKRNKGFLPYWTDTIENLSDLIWPTDHWYKGVSPPLTNTIAGQLYSFIFIASSLTHVLIQCIFSSRKYFCKNIVQFSSRAAMHIFEWINHNDYYHEFYHCQMRLLLKLKSIKIGNLGQGTDVTKYSFSVQVWRSNNNGCYRLIFNNCLSITLKCTQYSLLQQSPTR